MVDETVQDMGVAASPPGLRPFGVEPASPSQAEPLVPNADERSSAHWKGFGGDFLLYRHTASGRVGHKRLSKHIGGKKLPQFRHPTLEAAKAEAARLLTRFPESTFVILREVGRVKLKPASAIEAATAGETANAGSTEGESAVGEAETPNKDLSHD